MDARFITTENHVVEHMVILCISKTMKIEMISTNHSAAKDVDHDCLSPVLVGDGKYC